MMKNPKSENRNPNPAGSGAPPKENGKPYDLRERTFQFALRILQLSATLPDTLEARVIRRQLVGAGTSIGANVEEADGAASRADTRRSFVIAKKEAQETRFWLRIAEAKWGKAVLSSPRYRKQPSWS
jgi:four helix bundle protein